MWPPRTTKCYKNNSNKNKCNKNQCNKNKCNKNNSYYCPQAHRPHVLVGGPATATKSRAPGAGPAAAQELPLLRLRVLQGGGQQSYEVLGLHCALLLLVRRLYYRTHRASPLQARHVPAAHCQLIFGGLPYHPWHLALSTPQRGFSRLFPSTPISLELHRLSDMEEIKVQGLSFLLSTWDAHAAVCVSVYHCRCACAPPAHACACARNIRLCLWFVYVCVCV